MMKTELTVFIVDDDASIRDALALLLGLNGYRVQMFDSADSFLAAWCAEWAGVALIDVRMPRLDGLSLQDELNAKGSLLPIVLMSGHADIGTARRAFKANAVDILEKPLDERALLEAIEAGFARARDSAARKRSDADAARLIGSLTPREREVMQLVVNGLHNRDIAELLAISVRTVEVHKTRMMNKLDVNNVADLVRMSLTGLG
jgi:RNA polymerase sigma factor (sigma-70 family)